MKSEPLTPKPIVKWVGGKRGLLPALSPLLPSGVECMRLVEPFAGGAALFFASSGSRARLSDINGALMETYRHVQTDVESVIAHLSEFSQRHGHEHYYQTRLRFNARRFSCGAEAAAAFIYLNKTCFNGLYRENRRGEFNVPIGRYKAPTILDADGLRRASVKLRTAELGCETFDAVVERVAVGDFVYLDPPYDPASKTASFRAYTRHGFCRADQVRLRDVFVQLAKLGVAAMLSSSDTADVRELYRGWHVTEVVAARSVNCRGSGRKPVRELVVRNYA